MVSLAENPYAETNVKKSRGEEDLYRKRVWDYRIIFTINDGQLVILVLKVGSRGDVYKE
ncbi:type II toxin-antitoxin system RelE/ParE family toxin [Ammoniphilus sp. CFH 90114]|nr:type II toxin-antitoxin system RelE/ParE family toxin [Ammoniphilus sp. CFH 90114]